VAIVRIEQFYPLHTELLASIVGKYGKNMRHVWVQEEPRNAGAWMFLADAFREQAGISLSYIGRPASASPAVGSKTAHKYEQEKIITEAIGASAAKKAKK